MQKSHTETVMLIDPSGQAAPAIAERIALEHQRQLLQSLSRYSESHDLDRADPRAPWAHHDHYYADPEVRAFIAAGGARRAQAAMRRVAPPGTQPFEEPDPDYRIVPTPAAIATSDPAALARTLPGLISPPKKDHGADPLDYAIYVPADFASGRAPVQIWSDGAVPGQLMGVLQDRLTRVMRLHICWRGRASGPVMANAAQDIAPLIEVNRPSPGEGHEQLIIRSILPLLISYLLLMSLMLSGSWMLQGTVEERSNKLIETVLACVSPDQFMYGKLLGTIAVGLDHGRGVGACRNGGGLCDAGYDRRSATARARAPGTAGRGAGDDLLLPRRLHHDLDDLPDDRRDERQLPRRAILSQPGDAGDCDAVRDHRAGGAARSLQPGRADHELDTDLYALHDACADGRWACLCGR